jgi:hypothetical protein
MVSKYGFKVIFFFFTFYWKKWQLGACSSRLGKVRVWVPPLWVLCTQHSPTFLQEAVYRTWTHDPMVTKQQLYRCARAVYTTLKDSPVHVAPACARSREGSDHFGSYVCSLSLHFCKRLSPGLEPITRSQGNSFTTVYTTLPDFFPAATIGCKAHPISKH